MGDRTRAWAPVPAAGGRRPRVHRRRYEEIRDEVLALAQTSGAATTEAILDDLIADDMVAAPTTWSSQWLFTDVVLESGGTTCGTREEDFFNGITSGTYAFERPCFEEP